MLFNGQGLLASTALLKMLTTWSSRFKKIQALSPATTPYFFIKISSVMEYDADAVGLHTLFILLKYRYPLLHPGKRPKSEYYKFITVEPMNSTSIVHPPVM